MNFLTRALRAFWQEESALAAVEYGVLLGFILLACYLTIATFGSTVKQNLFEESAKKLSEMVEK